jgi:hypothetical protein
LRAQGLGLLSMSIVTHVTAVEELEGSGVGALKHADAKVSDVGMLLSDVGMLLRMSACVFRRLSMQACVSLCVLRGNGLVL